MISMIMSIIMDINITMGFIVIKVLYDKKKKRVRDVSLSVYVCLCFSCEGAEGS